MRLAYYAGASTAAAAACLLKAFHERPNFYSATVYLSQSSACLLILTNLLLLGAVTFMYCLQRLLYGPLRPIEIEQLSEKAWYAVLDTLLAMPSFREDVGAWLLTMFVLLLAGKVWGWIAEGRVDVLEQQPPTNPRLFHARLATSLTLSVSFDLYMTYYCFETVVADPRPGMMVIFTFEFAILTIFSVFTLLRYGLNVIATEITKQQTVKAIEERKKEIQAERATARQNDTVAGAPAPATPPTEEPIEVDENEVDVPGWEEKRRYLFALEVFTDFAKLILYIVFFTVSVTFNGLPMHIMRDVYMTFASFSKRLSDYVNYKKATSDMNARYPDATTAEIRDDSCIVCREPMVAWNVVPAAGENGPAEVARPRRDEGLRPKKLPCGHILHLRCLKAWLERQQLCPTCRRPVLTAPVAHQPQVNGAAVAPNPEPAAGQAQQVANRAAPQPRPRRNRARFFNLGPIRIGFLNGPAGEINELVNQMQGLPVQQHQRQDQTTVTAPAATQSSINSSVTQSSANTSITQADIARMHRQIVHDAQRLSLEQDMVSTLSLMNNELIRLQSVQVLRDMQHAQREQQLAASSATQAGSDMATSAGSLSTPLVSLSGSPAQQIAAGSEALPEGVTLPPGWNLIPLHAQQIQLSSGINSTQGIIHPQAVPQAGAPANITQVVSGNQQPPEARHVQASAEPHVSASADLGVGPTGEHGSPFFVPASAVPSELRNIADTSRAESATPAEEASTRTASSGTLPPQVQRPTVGTTASLPPWASQSWTFNPDAEAATPSRNVNAPRAEQTSEEDKEKKSRNVEVEDVPDSQT